MDISVIKRNEWSEFFRIIQMITIVFSSPKSFPCMLYVSFDIYSTHRLTISSTINLKNYSMFNLAVRRQAITWKTDADPFHLRIYRKTCNISRTLVGNKIVDHSDVVGASPVGAAPTTSSFSTWNLASRDSAKKATRQYDNLLSVGIWCALY